MTEAQLLSDQARVFADFPKEQVIVGPQSYDCLVMESREGSDLQLGGFANEDYHRLAIKRQDVGVLPVEGNMAVFRTRQYSVIRVERDDSAASVIIDIASRASSQQS